MRNKKIGFTAYTTLGVGHANTQALNSFRMPNNPPHPDDDGVLFVKEYSFAGFLVVYITEVVEGPKGVKYAIYVALQDSSSTYKNTTQHLFVLRFIKEFPRPVNPSYKDIKSWPYEITVVDATEEEAINAINIYGERAMSSIRDAFEVIPVDWFYRGA